MADEALVAPGRARVRVSTASGRVTVTAEERDDIVVTTRSGSETTDARDGVEVVLKSSSGRVDVRCPPGTDVMVGSSSGTIELRGRLGAARVTTASGSIDVESVASADLRTQSAHVVVQRCDGSCRVANTSGKVEVHEGHDVHVTGVSGSIDVAGEAVMVRTVSGKVRIATTRDAAIESVSGKVEVLVPPGFRPRVLSRDMRRIKVDVPEGDDGEIAVRVVSGSVRIKAR